MLFREKINNLGRVFSTRWIWGQRRGWPRAEPFCFITQNPAREWRCCSNQRLCVMDFCPWTHALAPMLVHTFAARSKYAAHMSTFEMVLFFGVRYRGPLLYIYIHHEGRLLFHFSLLRCLILSRLRCHLFPACSVPDEGNLFTQFDVWIIIAEPRVCCASLFCRFYQVRCALGALGNNKNNFTRFIF
jgi:hypothetical protein